MQEAIDEILTFVDEHYWLPLHGQAGLTAGEWNATGRRESRSTRRDCAIQFRAGRVHRGPQHL